MNGYQLESSHFAARVYLAGCLVEEPIDQKYHYAQKRTLGAMIDSQSTATEYQVNAWCEQFKYKTELENKCDEIINWLTSVNNCDVIKSPSGGICVRGMISKLNEVSLGVRHTFGPLQLTYTPM